jgi:hypothetical protein
MQKLVIYQIPLMLGHKQDIFSYTVEQLSLGSHANRL